MTLAALPGIRHTSPSPCESRLLGEISQSHGNRGRPIQPACTSLPRTPPPRVGRPPVSAETGERPRSTMRSGIMVLLLATLFTTSNALRTVWAPNHVRAHQVVTAGSPGGERRGE